MTAPPTGRRRRRARLLPASLLVALVAGCAGPVTLDPPSPATDATEICREMVAATPDNVDGRDRRETDPPSDYTAAWGDPAITLACGASKPSGLKRTSQCFEVNGVGWFAEQHQRQVRFTTIGRETFVRVIVPSDYAPEANALVDLAGPVKDHIRVINECV